MKRAGRGVLMNSLRSTIFAKTSIPSLFIFLATLAMPLVIAPSRVWADEGGDFRRAKEAATSGDPFEAQSLLVDFIEKYPKGANTLSARYLLGQLFYRRADHKGAAAEFAKIINRHPAWEYAGTAAYGLAMAQIGMLDYAAATRTLEMLLAAYPESEYAPDTLYWLAESLYRRSDYTGALSRFNEFLERYPDHPLREYALDSSAWCLEQMGKHGEAAAAREGLLEEFPDSLLRYAAEFGLATDYFMTGDHRKAAKHYLASASAPPPLGEEALFRAGLIMAKTDQTQEAVELLERFLESNPPADRADYVRLALASCRLRNGEFDQAEALLRTLLKEPADGLSRCRVSFQMALAQMGRGKLAEAAGRLSTIPREETCRHLHHDSILALAASLLRLNQPIIAAEHLQSFLDAAPPSQRDADVYVVLVGALLRTRRFEEARSISARLSADEKTVGKWPELVYYDGLCLFQTSQYKQAAESFERFIAGGKPDELVPPASYLEATSLLRSGKPAEAARRYDAFLKRWPDSPLAAAALYRTGLSALAMGKYVTASTYLERLGRRHASSPEAVPARYFLGISRMKSDDLAGAVEAFRGLLERNPQFELADRAGFVVGWSEFLTGDYESAGDIFAKLSLDFKQSPLADSTRFFASATRYKNGLFEAAGAGFREIPVLFPDSPLVAESLLWAGMCDEKLERQERASEMYRSALQLCVEPGTSADALYALAWAELGLADGAGAAAAFERLADEHPRSALTERAHFWKGRIDYASGEWEQSMESLLRLNRSFPGSDLADDALFFAARAARRSSDYSKAIGLFEELTQQFPESPFFEQSEIEAAECMIEAGKAGEAARRFERFIDNNLDSPLRPLALYDMGRALQRAGRFESAIEQYRAAAGDETTELAARAHFAIAECLAELDLGARAMAELISIAQGGFPAGWEDRAQLQVARLLERDDRPEEALQMYNTIAAAYGDEAAGMVALKAMERIGSGMWQTAER